MTEKRFMLDDAGELIDLNNHQFIDYGDEVCNLLNELHEENVKLRKEVQGFIKSIQDSSRISAEAIVKGMGDYD